jgi:TetR/AcrR family transcriptional regulator, repressor for uid operon
LFDETVREFKRSGFADTEIAVITDRVGVSRGAFYVHFAGKEAVLRQLLVQEETRIGAEVVPVIERGAPLGEVLASVVEAVLNAERRLSRRLVRDLCAAQFLPDVAGSGDLGDHPLATVLIEALADRVPNTDAAQLAKVFLTALFGLLATDDGPPRERRLRIDLLVELISKGAIIP